MRLTVKALVWSVVLLAPATLGGHQRREQPCQRTVPANVTEAGQLSRATLVETDWRLDSSGLSIQWEAGVGLGSGERTTRLFAGIDYEVFPDYQNQPKFSVKAGLENASEFGVRRNILGISPTVSKGFEANGKEFFPFFSLPVGISLDGDRNTYKTLANASMGVTGNLPFEEYKNDISLEMVIMARLLLIV